MDRGETSTARQSPRRDEYDSDHRSQDPCRQRLRGVVPGCTPDRPRVNKQRGSQTIGVFVIHKGVGMINSLFSTAMAFPPTASDEASSGQAL